MARQWNREPGIIDSYNLILASRDTIFEDAIRDKIAPNDKPTRSANTKLSQFIKQG